MYCIASLIIAFVKKSDPDSPRSLILVFVQFLLSTVSLIAGGFFVWLWVNNGPSETLAPNFLAACKPHGLDVLCSPDGGHLDWNPVVWVTCSTPPEMWISSLSNSLPPFPAIQAYLMFAAVIYIIYNWKWEGALIWLKTGLPLSGMALGIIFALLIGYFDVISVNAANFDKELVSGYLKCFAVACVWLAVDSFWQTTQNEQQLPRYWNDPTSLTGQIPTNLTPLPTTSLHEPPAATGSTTGETENVYQTIYPNLPPEYENPPSYGDSVNRY